MRIHLFTLLTCCAYIQAKTTALTGPTLENATNCEALFSIETSCSGETVNTYTIAPGNNITLNTIELPHILHNQQFCITVKPNCVDNANNDIQIVSPYFHDQCTIHYKNLEHEKTILLDEACFTQKRG